MLTNLRGLLRKADEARMLGEQELAIWVSGKALREFLYVDDMADACLFLMRAASTSALSRLAQEAELIADRLVTP